MLSVIDALQLSARVYQKRSALFIGFSAWLFLPIGIIFLSQLFLGETVAGDVIVVVANVGLLLMSLWVWIVGIVIAAYDLTDKPIDASKISGSAWRILGPVTGIALVVGIVQLAGFAFLILPGVLFLVWYAFAPHERILTTKQGVVSTLSASRDLSRGKFWPVLWRLTAGPVILLAFYLAISSLVVGIFAAISGFSLDPEVPLPIGIQTLGSMVDVLYAPLFVIYSTVIYLDLKRASL